MELLLRRRVCRAIAETTPEKWPFGGQRRKGRADRMRFVLTTGGVISGLGKGICSSSVGALLKECGLRVTAVKIDPYLNVDAGTMSPYEHGEVYVLADGTESDLDMGNYERFLDLNLGEIHNITTGRVFQSVLRAERQGTYLGRTVQMVPHVTDEILRRILQAADTPGDGQSGPPDVCLIELGGTVGDIESMIFLEALSQLQNQHTVVGIHVSLVPSVMEPKTKPTQHSVAALRAAGVRPSFLFARSSHVLSDAICAKLGSRCGFQTRRVFPMTNVESLFSVPGYLYRRGLLPLLLQDLGLDPGLSPRTEILTFDTYARLETSPALPVVVVGLVGKYTGLQDSYLSITKALVHAGLHAGVRVKTKWFSDEQAVRVDALDAMVVPGGFGDRGVQSKIAAIQKARMARLPFLGICLGMQCAVVEFARHVGGMPDAVSQEFSPDSAPSQQVVVLMPETKAGSDLGGTMRLGRRVTDITPDSFAHQTYGALRVAERHRHRYEVNPAVVDRLSASGLVFSGRSGARMEIVELPLLPFFVGVQFHPEFTSRPGRPNPVFVGLVNAARLRRRSRQPRPRRSRSVTRVIGSYLRRNRASDRTGRQRTRPRPKCPRGRARPRSPGPKTPQSREALPTKGNDTS